MATLQELLAEKARRQASVSPAVISSGVQTATTTGSNPRLEELLAEKARRQTQVVPEENNMFQKLAVNVIGRPAIRASQALVGLGVEAFGNEQQKTNLANELKKPVKLPLGFGTVAPQKEFGQGGIKQLALDTGKSALDIATLGAGSAVNMGLRKVGAKVLPKLAKSKLGRMAIGTASNVAEGLGYNTGVNILNEKPLTDNAGVTGIASAVLPPVIKGIIPAAKSIKRGVTGIFSPVNTMERVVGLNKLDYQKFQQTTGKRAGQYLNEIDAYGNIEEITTKLSERGYASKNKVDTGLEMIEGVYKPKQAQTMLEHLVERERSLGVEGKDTAQIAELANKFSAEGLTHKEMNTMKRIYERTVRFGYNKLTSPDVVEKATRIDDAFRQWQFKEASDRGFKDLDALNKETQATRNLLNAIGKKYSGDSNQAIGLGDTVLLSGGNAQAIAMYLGRKAFMDKGVQSSFAKSIYTGVKTGVPKGNVIPTSQFPRLNAPQQGAANSQVFTPIPLGAKTQSTIDAQEIARIQAQKKTILDPMLSPKPPQLLEKEKLTKSYTPSSTTKTTKSSELSTGNQSLSPKVKLPSKVVTPETSSAKEAVAKGMTEEQYVKGLTLKVTKNEPSSGSKYYDLTMSGKKIGEIETLKDYYGKGDVHIQFVGIDESSRGKGFASESLRKIIKENPEAVSFSAEPTNKAAFDMNIKVLGKPSEISNDIRDLTLKEARESLPDTARYLDDGELDSSSRVFVRFNQTAKGLSKQSPAAKAIKDGLTEEQYVKGQGT